MDEETVQTMARNYKEYDIKRPGFTDGIKVRVFKTHLRGIK